MSVSELKTAIVRQAYSIGLQPGTDAYDAFVAEKLSKPEINTKNHLGKDIPFPSTHELYMEEMDLNLIDFMSLVQFAKMCKRNAGMSVYGIETIHGINATQIQKMGRRCVALMVTAEDPVKQYLTGADSYDIGASVEPSQISGHRSSIGAIL